MWRNVLPESATGPFPRRQNWTTVCLRIRRTTSIQTPAWKPRRENIENPGEQTRARLSSTFRTVTTRAFAIYLSTRRSTQWPHVPTVWLLMSDAQRIFQTEVDLRIRMNLSVPYRQYSAWISHILYIANTMLTSRTLSFYTLMREDTFGESHFP